MTISGGITKQLDIFYRITGFTSDFLSFIVVELIRFFHGAIQLSFGTSDSSLMLTMCALQMFVLLLLLLLLLFLSAFRISSLLICLYGSSTILQTASLSHVFALAVVYVSLPLPLDYFLS